jgi:IS30 family transposase
VIRDTRECFYDQEGTLMKYRQLTSEERYTLGTLHRQGHKQVDIARYLGRHPSTISREIRRNRCAYDGAYRPFKADSRTRGRRSRSRRNLRIDSAIWAGVVVLLEQQWSPEQIARTLTQSGIARISHETIYRRIWADKKADGTLHTHLRGHPKQRRKRYGAYDSRGRIAGKRHISERPGYINDRSVFGHWEIDTVMGHGSPHCIITLVERCTGLTIIGQLNDRTVATMNRRLSALIRRAPQLFQSFTADNGTEFHGYAAIEKRWDIPFYFCTPYHSWERGTNENTNGLIRQYLPKRTSMKTLSQAHCELIAHKLNTRPRKRLGFQTPIQRARELA